MNIIKESGRECSRCGEFKVWVHFHNFKYGLKGKEPMCKECKLVYQRLQKYNISKEDLDILLNETACMICENEFTSSKDKHVDHCHITLNVRGLLCSNCNTGLGKFKDDPTILYNAIKYITP